MKSPVSRPRFSVSLHGLHALVGGKVRAVLDIAARADDIGIDCVTIPDHVVMGTRVDRYPYGTFPLPESFPWYEPMTLLTAVAAVTKRIHLAPSVLIAPLRPPVLLAKVAATLDCLSQGRLELGVGTGWQLEEYEAIGVPFEKRSARLIDGLRACRVLWTGERNSFESATVRYEEALSLPKPVGDIPFFLGMKPTPAVRGWLAELGAGWVPMAVEPEQLAADIEAIRAAYSEGGRDPAQLRVRAGLPVKLGGDRRPDLIRTLEGVEAAVSAGVTDVEIFLRAFAGSAAEIEDCLNAIARY